MTASQGAGLSYWSHPPLVRHGVPSSESLRSPQKPVVVLQAARPHDPPGCKQRDQYREGGTYTDHPLTTGCSWCNTQTKHNSYATCIPHTCATICGVTYTSRSACGCHYSVGAVSLCTVTAASLTTRHSSRCIMRAMNSALNSTSFTSTERAYRTRRWEGRHATPDQSIASLQ